MRSEKDIRLRIDLLEGQSSSIARMLARAMQEGNEQAIRQYSDRLALGKGKVEELLWVLGIKPGQGVLDTKVALDPKKADRTVTVRDALEMLRDGRIKMDDLPHDVQALVRKGALEAKNALKYST
ncbi:hypothetical protein [Nitrososphaera sp.]|uniref:hypothetical protein n=1 Tax=Nitrososphaera sp. TaxID=1971748 RepID=UPI00307F0944